MPAAKMAGEPGRARSWPLLLLGAAAVAVAASWGLELREAGAYDGMVANNTVDIDQYVTRGIEGFPVGRPSIWDRAKVVCAHSLSVLGHTRRHAAIPLTIEPSPYVPGLLVSRDADEGEGGAVGVGSLGGEGGDLPPLIVGTIRMGFGHHRIAYATSSWGVQAGIPTLFHDLLSVKSPEADLIKRTDELYSKGSRLASEIGGFAERFFGGLTAQGGDANALRTAYQLAEVIKPLFLGLPKDTPVIATHSLVGLVARAAGFRHVINMVIDNHPQWFLIVPGAINLVQGPKSYFAFVRMGVPESELRIAGHWIGSDIVDNIKSDCAQRKARVASGAPLRVLLPVGGAGAQRIFVAKFLKSLQAEIARGEVQVLVNAGDHKHMRDTFIQTLSFMGMADDYEEIDTIEGVHAFTNARRNGTEPPKPVTLFAFKDYFPAVAATDILIRVSDVLACKPSEMAFYPVPKLMLRRVGDHEADSAIRANELGDGTVEIREPEEAHAWVTLFRTKPSLLTQMNDMIMKNADFGIYDGCKKAVDLARQLSIDSRMDPPPAEASADNCTSASGYRVCPKA